MKKTGFDNEKYLKEQTSAILNRVKKFDNKMYLEFGGKLCYDYHAARVLPGFSIVTRTACSAGLNSSFADRLRSVFGKVDNAVKSANDFWGV